MEQSGPNYQYYIIYFIFYVLYLNSTRGTSTKLPIRSVMTRFSQSMEMSRLTRDGTAEPVSRDQILRHVRGQGNIHFPCSADHEQDWQPYPVDPYSAMCDDHIYRHTYIHTYIYRHTYRHTWESEVKALHTVPGKYIYIYYIYRIGY